MIDQAIFYEMEPKKETPRGQGWKFHNRKS